MSQCNLCGNDLSKTCKSCQEQKELYLEEQLQEEIYKNEKLEEKQIPYDKLIQACKDLRKHWTNKHVVNDPLTLSCVEVILALGEIEKHDNNIIDY
jgi:hypothetical protein